MIHGERTATKKNITTNKTPILDIANVSLYSPRSSITNIYV